MTPPRHAGFTLMELLVVLALVGLVTAVTAPRLTRMMASIERANERSDVLAQVAGLGYAARSRGTGFVLRRYPPEDSARNRARPPLDLPEGWQLRAADGIHYRASGACLGGELTVSKGDWEASYTLEGPRCDPRQAG